MGLILGLIALLAAVLRFPGLNYAPPELFGDEVDVGYQAYSLLHTGQDLYGQTLPTYIHTLAEWRLPLLMYATVPTIAAFGNNEWGVRVPEAVFGSLAPVILGLLVYQKTRDKKLSLLAAFFLAILPWHIHYSRAAFEVVLMLDLALLGIIFFWRKPILSALFLALTLYTYSTAIVFIPLLILAEWLRQKTWPNWKFVIAFALLLLPLGYRILSGTAEQRFNTLSVLNNQEIANNVFVWRQLADKYLGKVFYNKPLTTINFVGSNYLRAFSTDFLFIRGDPDYRQNLQIIGELLPISVIFVVLGMVILVKNQQWFWLVWLLLAPVPSALTSDGGYHATRLFWLIPPLIFAMALGAKALPKLMALIIVILMFFQLAYTSYYYLTVYRLQSWQWWHEGYKNAMTQLANYAPSYQLVFINNTYEPALERFLFWTNYSPHLFHEQFTGDKTTANVYPGYDGFRLGDKYYFGSFKNGQKNLQDGSLYLLSQRDDGVAGKILYTSTNGLGQPILYLSTANEP